RTAAPGPLAAVRPDDVDDPVAIDLGARERRCPKTGGGAEVRRRHRDWRGKRRATVGRAKRRNAVLVVVGDDQVAVRLDDGLRRRRPPRDYRLPPGVPRRRDLGSPGQSTVARSLEPEPQRAKVAVRGVAAAAERTGRAV